MKIKKQETNKILKIGQIISFHKTLPHGNKLKMTGIVYGYNPSALGGACYLVKELKLVEPKTLKVNLNKLKN